MEHSLEDCPDPFTCEQHSGELGKNLAPEEPAAVKIEIHKPGMPSLDGEKLPEEGAEGKAEEGLSPEEAEQLKKLVKTKKRTAQVETAPARGLFLWRVWY